MVITEPHDNYQEQPAMSSPTQRSLQYCRKNGWTAGVVEKWNQWAKIRQDLFGCIDMIVIDDLEQGPLAVQATSGSGHAARRKKSIAEPRLKLWLESPARFEIWSWSQRGPKDKRKLWTLRREPIILAQLEDLQRLPDQPSETEQGV
tara:strand:- start:1100 stop:1540 length:441 start_codon:yes stop_codon:yes gene_type:complete